MPRDGVTAAAWAVHLLTASGAAWALLALRAIGERRFDLALIWMAVAVVVDGLDGPLARRVGVARALPRFDGTLLDNLVDYLNYTLVPAWLLVEAELLPAGLGLPAAILICMTSAYQFCRTDAKTDGRYFRGFPSLWNVVAFYLLVLLPGPWVALGVVLLLCLLSFVPAWFVYPSRTPEWRVPTLTLTAAWALSVVVLIARYPAPPRWLAYLSLVYVAYYAGLSLALTLRLHRRGAPG